MSLKTLMFQSLEIGEFSDPEKILRIVNYLLLTMLSIDNNKPSFYCWKAH